MYSAIKTYGNDRGLSCVFRQHRAAHSHCSLLHGYSIGIEVTFASGDLDVRNWVMDFGNMKAFKEWAEYMFDHTLVMAADDPMLEKFKDLAALGGVEQGGVLDLRIVEAVGCEKFAELAHTEMTKILGAFQRGEVYTLPNGKEFTSRYPVGETVRVKRVKVFEHAGNAATFEL